MSNIKELIRAEIERLLKFDKDVKTNYYIGRRDAEKELLAFIDSLPDEPEQPTRGYDEAYLNEKIAKASKSWKGVDVDKFMDEIRGREPVSDCHDLAEAKEEYIRKDALMEWLEGMMTKEGATEGFVGGYDFALKDVINKLNEL